MAHRLTILTAPIEPRRQFGLRAVRRYLGRLRHTLWFRSIPEPLYGGHPAVTRSLVEGLMKIGADFNYNPRSLGDVGEICHVLSSIDALKQAIEWKQSGKIKRLIAGPNLVVLPSDEKEVIAAPEIDLYLVNSPWTRSMYILDLPELASKCEIWPAGVNTEFWHPASKRKEPGNVLIYLKSEHCAELMNECERILGYLGYHTKRLVYGQYGPEQFRDLLQQSEIAVFFSEFESQGLALAEAWSVDVPTLVWNPGQFVMNKGKVNELKWPSSSAPYLTYKTGRFFQTAEEFEIELKWLAENKRVMSPREWVMENLSDEKSATILLDHIRYHAEQDS